MVERKEDRNQEKEEGEASAVQIFLLLWIASSAVHLSEPVTRCPLPWLALVSSRSDSGKFVNKIICQPSAPAPSLVNFQIKAIVKKIKTLFSFLC